MILAKLKAAVRVLCALGITVYAQILGAPGIRFHYFGWLCAWRINRSGKRARYLFWNPLPLFRYPEFHFSWHSIDWKNIERALDVSSPRLFPAYILHSNQRLRLSVINPDRRDIADSREFFSRCGLLEQERVHFHCTSGSDIPYPDCVFDAVTSISVLEHVLNGDETQVLLSLWRCVRPGGYLILTLPVCSQFREEYKTKDEYSLGIPPNEDGLYFYQRVYDQESIEKHIIEPLRKNEGNLAKSCI
jgi:SAM-dependent methyltransferase